MNETERHQDQGSDEAPFAVVAHVFYADVWRDLAQKLRASPLPFDLFATVPDAPEFDAVAAAVLEDFPLAQVLRCPNRGRDVAPFLRAMEAFDLERYDVLLKVHTKRSNHLGGDGARWSADLFRSLFGSPEAIAAAVGKFRKFPQIGMIHPEFVKVSIQTELVPNLRWLDELQARLQYGPRATAGEWSFAAGTMFWFRGEAMRPLRELRIQSDEFEAEAGQVNGTLAHALERMLPQVVHKSGHMVLAADWIAAVADEQIAAALARLAAPPRPVARKGFRTPPQRGPKRR